VSPAELAAWVTESRAAQALPERVSDPTGYFARHGEDLRQRRKRAGHASSQ
jgi:hypothetical protein